MLCACGGSSSSSSSVPPESGNANPQVAPPTPPPTPETVIKALALYTQSLNSLYSDVDLRIQHLFNVTNDVLQTSGLDIEIALVHLEQVDYPDGFDITTALARIRHRYASWSRNEPDLVKSSALMIISSCRHGLRAPIAA